MDEDSALHRRLLDIRHGFDAAFAEPPAVANDAPEKFLAISVSSTKYVFRLTEIAGVAVDRRTTPLPGPLPELLGLTGMRGRILPVYSLAHLLGAATMAAAPRWLVFVGKEQLALAFDHVDGYVQALPADVLPTHEGAKKHCRATLRLGGSSAGILSVPSLLEAITMRVAAVRPLEEH